MALPPELEQQLELQIDTYEEAQKMTYVTSIERLGYQRGMEAGLQQGIEFGLQQGRDLGLQQGRDLGLQQGRDLGLQEGELQAARQAVLDVLQIRFGELPASLVKQFKSLDNLTMLKEFLKKAVTVASVSEFDHELLKSLKSFEVQGY